MGFAGGGGIRRMHMKVKAIFLGHNVTESDNFLVQIILNFVL